ncbi:MAG: hypothetical protein KGP35_06905 [Bacteroidetes bacterium]|nr:hypothetical protein [Bacteroidota bacterium]
MAVFKLKSAPRLYVLHAGIPATAAYLEALRSVNIAFARCKQEKEILSKMQEDMPVLLLEPEYNEVFQKSVTKLLKEKEEPIFILSSDLRWKEQTQKDICYYLPADTHPLELARLLVEKLNLPSDSNKPAYAFSFFQF